MSLRLWLALIGVILLMVLGQVLFKASAQALQTTGNWLDERFLLRFLPSLAVYGLATLAWVWVLRYIDLSRAYPFMALAFVFVPLASVWLFNERLSWRYAVGVLLICLGVMIAGSDHSATMERAKLASRK